MLYPADYETALSFKKLYFIVNRNLRDVKVSLDCYSRFKDFIINFLIQFTCFNDHTLTLFQISILIYFDNINISSSKKWLNFKFKDQIWARAFELREIVYKWIKLLNLIFELLRNVIWFFQSKFNDLIHW